jgi:hypothetical protein
MKSTAGHSNINQQLQNRMFVAPRYPASAIDGIPFHKAADDLDAGFIG